MKVLLARELKAVVEDRGASGNYATAADVIRESLLPLSARNPIRQSEANRVRSRIAIASAQADGGRVKTFEASGFL